MWDHATMESEKRTARPDYGLDAPGVLRNLGLASAIGLGVWASIAARLWSGKVSLGGRVTLDVTFMGLSIGLVCAAMGVWMVWSSKVGKLGERDRLLGFRAWTGAERVLDLGCGRGLLLIGAAKRLTRGSAVGVDLWQAEDLSGNRAEATLENARREGVAERVRVQTADMRALPFPDASFDVIVSKAAIHNVYDRAGRAKVMAEIARVLAPGGSVLIDDIRHLAEYERELRARCLSQVARPGNRVVPFLLALLTWGSLRPGVLVGKKP
jgi:SAM-dependent methyltransferase